MSETTQSVRWIVTGRVQGVYFRDFTRNAARMLGLEGWVRNLPDGSVEACARGDRDKLAALKAQLAEGPRMARVDGIREEALDPGADDVRPGTFEVRY